jgi:hypothetical protein
MGRDRVGAALLVAVFLWSNKAAAAGAPQSGTPSILDVPFLAQSEQLCGGAAAAMVLRYWGERGIFSEDFAFLLDARASGIRGDALAKEVRRRGWMAHSFRGDERIAQEHLAKGRPLITLVEDRPGRLHYVVLLAWAEGRVVLHDPARAPMRVVAESTFLTNWTATDFWALLILPNRDSEALAGKEREGISSSETASPGSSAGTCDALVRDGVELEQAGDRLSADAALSTALDRCPASGLAARELAGLRFVQSRWSEAARLATRAAASAPDDAHAWRLLAASRFIQDDVDGALEAWNRIGEPQIDLVRVDGLDRMRYAVVEDLIGLAPQTELTVAGLQRARRRLATLPVATATRVGYRPIPGGLAEIDAAIVERPRFPDRVGLAAIGTHALTERELRLDAAAPAGSGMRWIIGWRWWDNRPRLGMSLLAPAAFGRSGLWRLDGVWERQSYDVGRRDVGPIVREDRKRVAVTYSDWFAADTRLALGLAVDRWNGVRSHAALSGSIERRFADDRLAARAQGSIWPPLGRAASFGAGGLALSWRSSSSAASTRPSRMVARAGLESASARAPFDVWPGADVGHARDVLARAHPLLREGVVSGGLFGRTLAHGGMEMQAGTFARGPARLGVALFTDIAKAWHTLAPADSGRTQVDIGVGLRVRVAGEAHTLRIDVAQGLRDGRHAISAGWQLPWPQ